MKHCEHEVVLSELRVPRTLMRVDYMLPSRKLAIEVDGKGSHEWNPFFMKSRAGFLASIKRDSAKEEILALNGFAIIRITDKDRPLTKKFFEEHEIYL